VDAKRLEEIESRLKAATPGEWSARCREFSNTEIARNIWTEYGWICRTENCDQQENADFIAHAPTDISDLLSEVRECHEKIRVMEEALKLISSAQRSYECGYVIPSKRARDALAAADKIGGAG